MVEVQSSNIKAIGFEDNCLLVEYLNGHTYRYKDVAYALYDNLLNAESKGAFMNEQIKGKFEYEKIS